MRIGFIGVGQMGRFMVASLLRAGHEVTAFDTRPDVANDPVLAGVRWADSPKAAAAASTVVVTMLPGPDAVEQVILGANGVLEGTHAGDLVIDMSTCTPALARTIEARAAERGVAALDAPVTGSVRGARKATLTIMVGGTPDAFAAGEPVLKAMGERIFHVGPPGSGHVAKLVNNMMGLANGIAAMEAMVVGVRAGLDPRKLLEVVDAGTGASYQLNLFRYVIFQGHFEPAKFALSLAAKDLRLAVAYAKELGVPVRLLTRAAEALADAEQQGLGAKDWSAYITLLEEAAKVEVRSDSA